MGERTSYAPGTFSWVELQTTDAGGAKAFSGELFGWEAEDSPAGEAGTYTMFSKGGRHVAGMFELSDDMRGRGIPPHWGSYVTVADVDASAARVGELGGTVVAGPFDVTEAGRMATLQDPQGAMSLWEPREHPGAGLVNEPGALCWNDLLTADGESSARFYSELFGWRIEPVPGGEYWTIRNGEATNGGILAIEGMPPVWNAYFAADGLEATIGAIERAGRRRADAPARGAGRPLRGRDRPAGSGVLAVRGRARS